VSDAGNDAGEVFRHTQLLEKYTNYDSIARYQTHMSRVCQITGKGTQVGGRYSNRTRATQFNPCGKVRRAPNLQKKRVFIAELGKTVTLSISTKALRTIAKNGAFATLSKAGLL